MVTLPELIEAGARAAKDAIALTPQAHVDETLGSKMGRREIDDAAVNSARAVILAVLPAIYEDAAKVAEQWPDRIEGAGIAYEIRMLLLARFRAVMEEG